MIRFCVQRSSGGYPDIQLPNSFERHGDICRGREKVVERHLAVVRWQVWGKLGRFLARGDEGI